MPKATTTLPLVRVLERMDRLTNWEKRAREEMDVGLASIKDLLHRLGNPQNMFRSIHVTGTKGKGSVCALLEVALNRAGWRVGRYASPHVERVTERISVEGLPVDEAVLAQTLSKVLDKCEAARAVGAPGGGATWFDVMTAAAFVTFQEAKMEWAVVEVGLGGRTDSTNVINSEVCIVTNVELEHTEVLGHTREAIAREKAGILKPGAILITNLAADDVAGRVLQEQADLVGCPVFWGNSGADASIRQSNVELAGLALNCLGQRGVSSRPKGERIGVGSWLLDEATCDRAQLPGRLERINVVSAQESGADAYCVPTILDGAHIPFNLAAVMQDLLRHVEFTKSCIAVVSLAADKDARGFLRQLSSHSLRVVCTEVPSSGRSYSAMHLHALAESLGIQSEAEPNPLRAFETGLELAAVAKSWLLVTGSLALIGAVRRRAICNRS
ncbi:MAG: dihydrofolate synthase / folylpolyglutamate synthase [Acetobacteraceae bacterium]|jgi:dihydrofolate synthase/folylpolyglutamate synthase|nr:dihydrofolate synthase / folylpolyglutamate synthase [Acetobacteraceae bacterium]